MNQRYLTLVFALTCLLLFLVSVRLGYAQMPTGAGVGSQMTALSIAQGGGIRILAMGGTTTSVPDESNIRNAALLPLLNSKQPADYAVVSTAQMQFDNYHEFSLRSYSLGQVYPGKGGFLVRRTSLGSDTFTSPVTGVSDSVSYSSMLLAGGVQVSPNWTLGATAAFGQVEANAALGSVPVARIRGRGTSGIEVGTIHSPKRGVRLGFVYSHWNDEETVQIFLPVASTTATTYATTILKGGVSYQPNSRTTLGLEWSRLEYENKGTGATYADSRPYFGLERLAGDFALRAGSHGNAPTAGLGWQKGGWRVDYAFVKDLNKKSAERMFGGTVPGSESHYLAATIRF